MTMTLSVARGGFSWRGLLRERGWIALCLAAMAAVWALSALAPAPARVSSHVRSLEWRPAVAGEALPTEGWRPFELGAGLDGAPIWFRVAFELKEEEALSGTATVSLPGMFSARAYLNGVEIGSKGVPAFAPDDEQPGPIDTALPLGPAARVGMNEVLLFVSAHHTRYRPEALLQGVEILPHGGEAQRPLATYGVALSQVGVLLAIAAAFGVLAWRRRERALSWAAAGAALLLLAMAAETARTWWSYPYPYQIVRLGLVWLGLSGFGIALVLATAARFGVRLPLAWSLGAAALAVVVVAFTGGIDDRIRITLCLCVTAAFAVVARRAPADKAARVLAAILAATAMLLVVRGPDTIDNWIYVLGAMMLAVFAWPARVEAVAPAPAQPAMLALDDGAIALADVAMVKAAGNYAEVYTLDRRCLLVRKPLTDMATSMGPGAPLMRVHRSYIVNLSRAVRLVAKTGSRYELELADGDSVPVSRKLADAVRAVLAERLTAH